MGDSFVRGSASREPGVGAWGERQMEWTIPGAIVDETVPPDAELCMMDEQGRIVVLVVPDSEPRVVLAPRAPPEDLE